MTDHRPTDIILPIYNAFDDLTRCLEALFRNTPEDSFRLLAIEDQSSDKRVLPHLEELAREKPNVCLVPHTENRGFVSSVNDGLAASEGHVVLLNTDTMVTPGWLERMLACLQSDDAIASVTPLSNNATLASVPVWNEENSLPQHIGLDEYARLISLTSLRRYPRIPLGVGFCLLLRREALAAIGGLDEGAFGRGYGEENDWCYRATRQGYTHALCDDAFVYHRGGSSFGPEKETLYKEHQLLLEARYPAECENTRRFLAASPLQDIGGRVAALSLWDSPKPFVLFLTHNQVFAPGIRGGVEKHVAELMEGLGAVNSITLAARPDDRDHIFYEVLVEGRLITGAFPLAQPVTPGLPCDDVRALLHAVAESLPLLCVHVHHWMFWPDDLFDMLDTLRVPVALTLHDYYALCPNYKLLDNRGAFCGLPEKDACRTCYEATQKEPYAGFAARRQAMARAFPRLSRVYTASRYVQSLHQTAFPEAHYVHRPFGVPGFPPAATHPRDEKLRVGVLGNMTPAKGSQELLFMLQEPRENLEWHIFGRVLDPGLSAVCRGDVHFHGPYPAGTGVELLQAWEIDTVCLPSIWPETYSYTLTEAIQAGCPVVAFSWGAMGDRIEETGCGWAIDPVLGAQGLLAQVLELMQTPDALDDAQARCQAQRFPTLISMAAEYEADYLALGGPNSAPAHPEKLAEWLTRQDNHGLRHALGYQVALTPQQVTAHYPSTLYYDLGQGFTQANSSVSVLGVAPLFSLTFPVPPGCRNARWDPVEGIPATVRLDEIRCTVNGRETSISALLAAHNGQTDPFGVRFEQGDPYFTFALPEKTERVTLKGLWHPGTRAQPTTKEPQFSLYAGLPGDTAPHVRLFLKDIIPGKFQVEVELPEGLSGPALTLEGESETPMALRLESLYARYPNGRNAALPVEGLPSSGDDQDGLYHMAGKGWLMLVSTLPLPQKLTITGELTLGAAPPEATAPSFMLPHIYWDTGSGFSETEKQALAPIRFGAFHLSVPIPEEAQAARWDPLEGQGCALRLDAALLTLRSGVQMSYPFKRLRHNGTMLEDTLVFTSPDPWVTLEGLPPDATALSLSGLLLSPADAFALPQLGQTLQGNRIARLFKR